MIKGVIIEPEARKASMAPYFRNDQIISRELNFPVINGEFHNYWNEKIEKIVLSYAASWSDISEICRFLKRHKESQIFWLTIDYTIRMNTAIRRALAGREITFITNYTEPEDKGGWRGNRFHQMNLNTLLFNPMHPVRFKDRKHEIVYYGMYRKDRAAYFKKYLSSRFIISTSPKNIALFKAVTAQALNFVGLLSWRAAGSTLRNFKFSLYLEDRYTHNHYNYPANRFYEALNHQVVQLFDRNCANTFQVAGYDVSRFFVDSKEGLHSKIDEISRDPSQAIRSQSLWKRKAKEERKKTLLELREILL